MNQQKDRTIVVTGTAAVSPVGFRVEQTCASIRAGICRFHSHPFYFPKLPEPPLSEPEPATAAFVPTLSLDLSLPERLMGLATLPMQNFIESAALKRNDLKSAGIFVSLPSTERTRQYSGYERAFVEEYLKRLGMEAGRARKIYNNGNAGVLSAVGDATHTLLSGSCRFAILIGVDSYADYESLKWLDESYRLKSERNVDGFIPGEAGVILLLETLVHARMRNARILGRIEGLGAAVETENIHSEKGPSGKGLVDASRKVFQDKDGMQSIWVICDLNGESYRAQEWGIFLCRAANRFQNLKALWHPADCVGDVGAASAGLYISMACEAFKKNYAPSDRAFIWCASDDGKRAACLVARADSNTAADGQHE